MSEKGLYQTLWLAPAIGTLTAFRVGAEVGQIWGAKAPELLKLGMDSWRDPHAADTLQQQLYTLAQESCAPVSAKLAEGIKELEQIAGR